MDILCFFHKMPIIKKVITKNEDSRAVVVDFQNGKIKSQECDNLESSLYRSEDGKRIAGVTNGSLLYTGLIDTDNDLYNNFLLVHNKVTGKVRLIQVDCCTVSACLDKKNNNIMDVSEASASNSITELNKQFGSKRSKRSTEQRERLNMDINTVKEQLEETVSNIKIDETDTVSTAPSENDNVYRPKINRDASTVDQVYNLEDIVPMSVLNTLSEEAVEIIEDADLTKNSLAPFISKSISEILEYAPDELKIHRITIFLYINYLIKFMNTPVKNFTKKFILCDRSPQVNNHILDNYSIITASHNRTRPLTMKDKVLCSILVLAALAMDYEVNIEALAKDFKIGIKKAMEVSRVLAFSPSAKNKNVVTLKLPLPEPVSFSLKRKRR
ncbi:hypothetical protein NQ315_009192 [Exocentrus adspersus]|uniref:DNA-directed RNA polymerase I subunit RPA49 n=1 Tax=Exocentrus adspersus TaxID=1586481 RepID=A0AAV8WG82_9CUCU|nr:hypothetical protein NQ315_009192 [Exocentrus adspersus]